VILQPFSGAMKGVEMELDCWAEWFVVVDQPERPQKYLFLKN
jgi:hypothetical protein